MDMIKNERWNFVLGYKVFHSDWTCREFQYEVGRTYRMDDAPRCCERGFHFCKEIIDCFDYYGFSNNNKFALVKSRGGVVTNDGKKFATNVLKILKEVSWTEVLKLVNTGDGNTGVKNSGNWNSGSGNIGNRNSGNWNSGNDNTGDWNIGSCNSGDWNTGWFNDGDYNSGDFNTGSWNTGCFNSRNWNTGSLNTGCFDNRNNNIFMFNKLTSWTMSDWDACEASVLLHSMPVNIKERQEWYDALNIFCKNEITSLPNFDSDIFKEITGISVNKEYKG